MSWRHESDENPKRKHHWDEDHAGFVEVGPNHVGKCPATMSPSDAQALLAGAIPYFPPAGAGRTHSGSMQSVKASSTGLRRRTRERRTMDSPSTRRHSRVPPARETSSDNYWSGPGSRDASGRCGDG